MPDRNVGLNLTTRETLLTATTRQALARAEWSALTQELGYYAEQTCGRMRRWARMLDDLATPETPRERDGVMTRLKEEEGVSVQMAHEAPAAHAKSWIL